MFSRRHFVRGMAVTAAAFTTRGVFAEELARTAHVDEGPFYPDKMPLDTDNDLLIVNDGISPAVGEITHLSGRVLGPGGDPIRNAFIEIWQVDSQGSYIHSDSANRDERDKNFQGYGRFLTDAKGQYYFRTVKPVPYPGRTPHIHVGISRNGRRIFTTQLFIKGHPQNDQDFLFRAIGDAAAQKTVMADFKPIEKSKLGELAANFEIVLGVTAQELEDGTLKGGIGKSDRSSRGGRKR